MERSPDRLHFTNLKRFSDSPAHFLASLEEEADTPAFKFGRLVHYLVLGGGDYVVWEGGDRRGKVWDAFKEANAGRDIYKASEVDEARRIATAVTTDRVAAPYLEGEHERLVDWAVDGVLCQSHIDILNGPRRRLLDLKTTTSAKPEVFHWDLRRHAYHSQLAWYQQAAAFIGVPVDECLIIAVEKEPPYAVTVFELTPALILEGWKLARSWLERYKLCKAQNVWPAYAQSVVPVDVLPKTRAEEPLVLTMPDGSEMAIAS